MTLAVTLGELILIAIGIATIGVMLYLGRRPETTVVDIGPVGRDIGPVVQIDVRNQPPAVHPVQVVGAQMEVSGPQIGQVIIDLAVGVVGATVPGAVPPNGTGSTWVPQAQLPMNLDGWSVRAQVWVAHRQKPVSSRRMAWICRRWTYTN